MEKYIHVICLDPVFPLGILLCTRGAQACVNSIDILLAINRHSICDWGELCDEDKATNDQALEVGSRLFSSYRDRNEVKFYIITEADRSSTTILLPEEY